MVDFKKATSKLRYDWMKAHQMEMFREIVAFSSTFGDHTTDLKVRAQVEDFCMGIAREMFRRGENSVRDRYPL